MLSRAEEGRIIEEIAGVLRECERYAEQDFLNRYSPTTIGETASIRLLVWAARQIVQATDGIVFGVIPRWPGTFRRLDWSQMERQARRQCSAGTRKHKRAELKLRLASTLAPDSSKERLSDAADRVALRLAMQAARNRSLRGEARHGKAGQGKGAHCANDERDTEANNNGTDASSRTPGDDQCSMSCTR